MALDCVVLGAGITGLAIAHELVRRGYRVGIVAKDLPEDSQSVGFASPWAGCNWCSFADDNAREQEWDRKTYNFLAEFAKEQPDLCELIPFFSYDKKDSPLPWFKDLAKDFRVVEDAKCGPSERLVSYKSFIIHAPNYLAHLAAKLRGLGVQIHRQRLSSIHEAYDLPEFGKVSVVVNASGLGAKSLLGTGETKDVYPIRGQTVLVRAPGVKECYMRAGEHPDASTSKDTQIPEPTYIIPRPGPQGHVVLGGSFQVNNWEYAPDYELAKRILQKNYELCPALAGPNGTSWEDIEIVAHNVGFRPSRAGGARLDLEEISLDQPVPLAPRSAVLHSASSSDQPRGKVACLHAYGIGPAGYQASVGYADEAADMVQGWLGKKE